MVREGEVLLGVEYLQERAGRVAAEIGPDLVDFVQHEDRVVGACPVDLLDDAPRQGAYVGAPVPPDFRLVPHAAQRNPDEFAAERAGDRLAQAGLAYPRGADEAEDRTLHLVFQRPDGEVFQDPLLHLLEVVVVLVQYHLRLVDVLVVLGAHLPGDGGQVVEVGARNGVFGG